MPGALPTGAKSDPPDACRRGQRTGAHSTHVHVLQHRAGGRGLQPAAHPRRQHVAQREQLQQRRGIDASCLQAVAFAAADDEPVHHLLTISRAQSQARGPCLPLADGAGPARVQHQLAQCLGGRRQAGGGRSTAHHHVVQRCIGADRHDPMRLGRRPRRATGPCRMPARHRQGRSCRRNRASRLGACRHTPDHRRCGDQNPAPSRSAPRRCATRRSRRPGCAHRPPASASRRAAPGCPGQVPAPVPAGAHARPAIRRAAQGFRRDRRQLVAGRATRARSTARPRRVAAPGPARARAIR